jgi:Domain of unknown function (DUF5668)
MQARPAVWKTNDWIDIVLPIVLTVTGLILIGGDRLGVLSLDRIQNLWPVALILIGVAELFPRPEQVASAETRDSKE